MKDKIIINARDLGSLKLADFCPRCFWLRKKFLPMKSEHPFSSPLPGIVSTLDSYIKNSILNMFREEKELPVWLREFFEKENVVGMFERLYEWRAEIGKFCLTGRPDGIWRLDDGSLLLAEYKVAKWSEAQERLLPLYEYQVKAYGYLAKRNGYNVNKLVLIYFQPRSRIDVSEYIEINSKRLTLQFSLQVIPVKMVDDEEIEKMVKKLGEILLFDYPPPGKKDCPGCKIFNEWLKELQVLF